MTLRKFIKVILTNLIGASVVHSKNEKENKIKARASKIQQINTRFKTDYRSSVKIVRSGS